MQKNEVNILFTSVGRRIELLRAFHQAYKDLELKGNIVGTDIDILAPALQETNTCYIVPRTDDPDFIPVITKICKKEKIDLVFPLIDTDIPKLASKKKDIEESTRSRLMVVSEDSARITADKWETFCFFRNNNIPTPYSWLPDQIKIEQTEYPVFLKPRFGSAAKNTFKIRNKKEIEFFIEYVEKPIIQEFLPGPEITNDVFCDFDGQVIGLVSRQRIEVRWGEVAKGKTVFDPLIAEGCIKIVKAMRATGPVTVQCIIKDAQPVFTEINARYGGGSPLGIAAGVQSPQWYLSLAAGRKVSPMPLGSYKQGLHITRYDQSFFLDLKQLANVENCRL